MSATAAVTSETTTAAEMSAAAAAAAMRTTKDQAREEVRHQSPWRSLQEVRTCEHPDCAFLVHSNPFIGAWGLGRLEALLGPWRPSGAPGPPSPPKALPHLWGPSSFLWPWRTARLRGDTGENSSPWAASLASSSKRYEYGHDMPASPAQGNRGERVEDAGGGS